MMSIENPQLLSISASLLVLAEQLFAIGEVSAAERIERAAKVVKLNAATGRVRPLIRVADRVMRTALDMTPQELFEVRDDEQLLGIAFAVGCDGVEIVSPQPARVQHEHGDKVSSVKVTFPRT